MARFSFIIPVYNVKPYLAECLESVLQQDFDDFEICLVDDGSTDGSEKLCDEFAAKEKRIKLLHQPNGGVSVARNRALEIASGMYVWFVDADDYILPKALTFVDTVITQSGCDTVFFGKELFHKCADIKYDTEPKDEFLANHVCYCNPLIIFRRSVISEHKLRFTEGMKMGEDLEFQYKYLLHCKNPVAIPWNFYVIRERQDSASRNSSATRNNLLGCHDILQNMLGYLEPIPNRGDAWIGNRMVERLKGYMQSAAMLHDADIEDVQKNVRYFIHQYKALGYKQFNTTTLNISKVNVRLYFALYKLLLRLNRIR